MIITLAIFFLNVKSVAKTSPSPEPEIKIFPIITEEIIEIPEPPKPSTIEIKKPVPVSTKGIDLKSAPPDVAKLQNYLTEIKSPLAPHAAELAKSEFWALLIGICHIEQHGCTTAPKNNMWGMMNPGGSKAGIRSFADLPEAIAYMDSYFIRLYPRKSTIESLRGYYCASACTTWEPTVKKIKAKLEAL
ncbi:MAG TPA: hypothetical protein VIU13_14310 [Chryseolinea sp.]